MSGVSPDPSRRALMTGPAHQPAISRRAFLVRSVACGAGALWLSACNGFGGLSVTSTAAPHKPATAGPKRGGTLRMSQPVDVVAATVPYLEGAGSIVLTNLVYDTLVRYDTHLNVTPGLATSWAWSPDFLQLTLKLRPDVKFHTGRPFTSAEAKFNLDRLRDPTVGSQWLNYASEMQVNAPDPQTLIISYSAPSRSSFDALTNTFLGDPETLDQTRAGTGFVGTGPFRFKEWMPGDHFTVVRNPDYWQPGKPYLDEVDVRIIPDAASALVNLESGSADWMIGVSGQDALRLQKEASYDVVRNANGSLFYYLGFDVSAPALADKRVRQAFACAVNRQRMVDTILYGYGRAASIFWPEQSPAYDADLARSGTYDLAKARALLAAANWDPNTVVSMTVISPATQLMAEIIQQDLASIGVKVSVQQVDQTVFASRVHKGQIGDSWIAVVGFMNASPATLYSSALPLRVPNPAHFESRRYAELINQSRVETDDQKLAAELRELTQITVDEAFAVPIAETYSVGPGLEVIRTSVKDVTWDDWGSPAYQDVWLEQ